MRSQKRCRSRLGITLIEVLMSIFVIAIGLFGVLSLLPLGQYQASEGTKYDRAASLGRRGLADFVSHGYHALKYNYVAKTVTSREWLTPSGGTVTIGGGSYLLDPIFTATNSGVAAFPASGAPALTRVTLRKSPGVNEIMTYRQAISVFRSEDDLVFESPKEDDQSYPRQVLTTDEAKRISSGHYSWFATIVPEGPTNVYRVSTAVVQMRDFVDRSMAIDGTPDLTAGGGVVTISDNSGPEFQIKSGEWVMLAAANRFVWYRVSQASPSEGGKVRLTLQGRDWGPGVLPTRVFYFHGTVAVYEKVIRFADQEIRED